MAGPKIASAVNATACLSALLARARQLKQSSSIDPPLPASEFQGALGLPSTSPTHFTAVDVAARQMFQDLVSSRTIDDPAFVDIWSLLDIILICGDQDQCEPALVWWLIEELLDSQSIEGCRIVFDYLESRRERLIAKNFQKKKDLVILRSCNELLRRLSRAEDSVFCGRVFIFLFQSFPLGDRSSVNLRGEFHVENVTAFDETLQPAVDATQDIVLPDAKPDSQPPEIQVTAEPEVLDEDRLYPIFWTLQKVFSNPPFLLTPDHFAEFKRGLEATLVKFRHVPKVIQPIASEARRGIKRKAEDMNQQYELASAFNPKYLTNRDLFKLELSDLAFQRHILVQALILLDFLLSLTDKAKKRMGEVPTQKALQYDFTLSDEDTEWCQKTKKSIGDYLDEGPDGKFYHRMVDTVLSRDKNWVRWKLESCAPISKASLPPKEFADAKEGARTACSVKRLRSTPMRSLDLSFLSDTDGSRGWESLKESARTVVPSGPVLVKKVQATELDIDFASSDAERQSLTASKTANTWRVLRLAAASQLSLLDKVDDGRNLGCLFQAKVASAAGTSGESGRSGGRAAESGGAGELEGKDGSSWRDGRGEGEGGLEGVGTGGSGGGLVQEVVMGEAS